MSREPRILRRIVNLDNARTPFSTLNNASPTGSTFASRLAADPTRAVGIDGKKLGFDPAAEIDMSSVAGKVQNALLPAIGYIDKEAVFGLIKRLKLPIVATIGIAAVAGLTYLAYRLFKSRQEGQPKQSQEALKVETVETVMEDLHNIAPGILSIESWRQWAVQKVTDAIGTKTGDQLVEELAKISASLKEKQAQLNPTGGGRGGSLLDIIATRGAIHGMGMLRIGGGLRTAF